MSLGVDSLAVDSLGVDSSSGSAGSSDNLAAAGTAATSGSATISGGASSITLTDLTQAVYQRVSGYANISVVGTYAGSPAAIQARVVQAGTSTEVVTWTTVDASPSGGAFSGSISVPEGGQYNLQVRFSDNAAITDSGAFAWGVGILVLLIGQSQLVNWFDVGTHSSVTGAYKQSGSAYPSTTGTWSEMPTTGNGANEFAAQLIAQYSVPVGLLKYAVGGTLLSQWDQTTDTYHRNAVKAVADCGGAMEVILWAQGEADGSSGTSQSAYTTALTNMIAAFRSEITNASGLSNLPVIVSLLGRGSTIGTDDQAAAIRSAQFAVCGTVADAYVGATTLDLPLADSVHYTSAGYVTHAQRMSQAFKALNGDAAYYRGPYIVSAESVDSTHTDVTIAHRGGSDFTPTSAINGFEIDDGSIVVPSAAIRQSATVIRLTHATLAGAATVRYGYGDDGGDTFAATISNILVDNTTLALPLEQAFGVAIAAEYALSATGTVQVPGAATGAVAIALGAVGVVATSATATGQVTVSIAADGLATAAATAGLSSSILLQGAAAASAAGNATLSAMLNALAAGSASVTGTATIDGGAPAGVLQGSGQAATAGAATLVVTVNVAAAGAASVSGSAALSGGPDASLAAAGSASASGAATAAIAVRISAAGFASAMGTGTLTFTFDGELLSPGPLAYRAKSVTRDYRVAS